MAILRILSSAALIVTCLAPAEGLAQSREGGARPVIEATVGRASFVDDSPIHHFVIGGSSRFALTRRVSVGPEVLYMVGPGDDRDFVLTGNLIFDLVAEGPSRRPVPFLVAGAGLFTHRDRFGARSFSSTEGSFTAGGGLRLPISDAVYLAPEFRFGWELHYRVGVTMGFRLR